MKSYNEFVNNRLNEEAEFGGTKAAKGIGGMFKNLLGGLLKDVKDELKKPLEDLNKKLGNEKEIGDMVKTVNKYLYNHRETLVKSLEEAKTVPGILETVEDNIKTAYASIGSSIKNFGKETYTFEELFKDAPERTKKLFSKDTKKFDKNVEQFSKDLILSIGKPYKITEEDLEKTPEEAKNDQEEGEVKKAQGEEETETEEVESPENLDKLKEAIQNWFDDTIYKKTKKKMEEVEKQKDEPEKEETGDLNQAIENIPNEVTDNKDSVKSIVNKLTEVDKNTMIKVRDLLGLTKEDTPL